MRIFCFLSIIVLLFGACVEPQNSFTKVPPGQWRAVLLLDDNPVLATLEDEEVSTVIDKQGDLPFNFEVVYDTDNDFHIELINGEERIRVEDIEYGRDRATAKDTLIIKFPVYDTYIKAIYEEDIMEGDWFVNYKEGYSIPFKAYYGQSHRFFTTKKEPVADISGKWQAYFEVGSEDEYPAIGEFKQKENALSGTFLTETGDYRYLDGSIQGNKTYLSCFDGAHAFLFLGKILEDGSLTGLFRSGKHYATDWTATKDENASLSDAFELTTKVSEEAFDFSFTNTENKLVSLSDNRYQGKVKLVNIMGTWCPNCRDESNFLKTYLAEEKPDDVAIISLAFEEYSDEAKSRAAIQRYKEKGNIPWEVLLAGPSDKAEASKVLPQLSGILSYPTLLFVDKENQIRKIHTGFAGPATSAYKSFEKDFKSIIKTLRAE